MNTVTTLRHFDAAELIPIVTSCSLLKIISFALLNRTVERELSINITDWSLICYVAAVPFLLAVGCIIALSNNPGLNACNCNAYWCIGRFVASKNLKTIHDREREHYSSNHLAWIRSIYAAVMGNERWDVRYILLSRTLRKQTYK